MYTHGATNLLAALSWGQWLLAVLLILVCFLLMIVILLQKGRGGGLAGAFGGAGGMSAFGAKTGDVFTWITVIMAGVFVLLTVVANFAFDQSMRPKTPPVAESVIPIEGVEGVEGASQGQPLKFELGTTDPVTGEKKIIPITAGEKVPIQPAAPAPTPPPPPPTEQAKPAAEPATPPAQTPPKEEQKPPTP